MKLLEISVKNFRSINGENIKLSLENSNIIFVLGQNNAGKSALLYAYEYLVTPKQKALLSDFFNFDINNKIEIIAVFEKEENDVETFAKKGFDKWVNEEGKIKFRKTWINTEQEGQKETWDPATNSFIPDGFGGLETHFNHHAPTPIRIPAFPSADELSKWVKDTIKKSALKQLKEEEAEAYAQILTQITELQDRIISKDIISTLSSQANKNFKEVFPDLALSISPVEGTEFDISKSLESEFSVIINDSRCPDIKQDFNHHGHGVIRQAMFNFLGIVKNNLPTDEHSSKKFIILFEEPEVYLHPKAIKLLRNVLYNLCEQSPFQLVCASHSPGLIDISRPHTSLVRLVRNSNAETYLYQAGDDLFASDEEQKQKVQMINRFDPNVCESFFADEIILVEGDTEAIVCREILSNSFPTKDIYVLNTGSKNNIPFFQKIFTHFRIKHHIIHDSDTRFIYNQIIDEHGQLNYTPILKKDDTQRRNSAWILNSEIWTLTETANAINPNLCRRFVSIYNFEYSNKYIYNSEKGKPLSAYEFVNNHVNISETNIYKFVSCIAGATESNCTFSSEELEVLVIEPNINRIAVESTLLEGIAKVVTKTTPNTSDFVIKEV